MAERNEEEKASGPSENLTCPLCFGILDEATILTSCEHTFCRKCLKNYDLSHQDLDHMICPLCRKITKLSANRVDDFLTNVTVNGLVDDYHAKCGGMKAVLEMRPKCTACMCQQDAVSFCCTCNNYMCDKCLDCHQHLKVVFKGHKIVSIQDIINGKVRIGHLSEKCCIHKQENKDMFCEDCKVYVCLKCVIVGHQIHHIKNQADFKQELQLKVNDLVQRCAVKKTELEKNIHNVEEHRHKVYTAVQKLLDNVSQAYSIKAKELIENHRNLVEQINAVKRNSDDNLNVLKSKDRQRIKSICSSITLIANDGLDRLELYSLSAHTLLCEDLDAMLKEATDHTSAAAITKKTQEKRFEPAGVTRLDLGSILEPATDHTSAAATTRKAQEKKLKPTCNTRLDPESIYVQVIMRVGLRGEMEGMTPYSEDSVALTHTSCGIDIINSHGKRKQYANIPTINMMCFDLVFQQDRSLCVSTGSKEAHIYSHDGARKSTIRMQGNRTDLELRLNRVSPSDDILIANDGNQVFIYDPTGSTLKHTVPTKHRASQASSTRSGLIITSTCIPDNGSVVTVYDRKGNAGKSLHAPDTVSLYVAVDEQDRVYVAFVDAKTGNLIC
ncbi:tripartite motif-containing protein 45-like [Strongylocentrotus purpuratus]|uniref:Uncharacterized protein n=1 Tax=Strongylocentrotus purpuratus TaxID=7668 RepID=A0A7M7PDR4_STRPU|nr:tripartite motif-containing protein 45-like [Strongylocentrotus purpuratus]